MVIENVIETRASTATGSRSTAIALSVASRTIFPSNTSPVSRALLLADIVTPGGNSLSGAYDRHGFAYTVPEGQSGAGASVIMAQQNEGTIHVATDPSPGQGADPALEVWHRCPPPTS